MTVQQLIAHVEKSLELAKQKKSKCDVETLQIKGFSTHTMRHFFNNLCATPVERYMEVGLFFGASACAAMCENRSLGSTLIEDFSQDFSDQKARESLLASLRTVQAKTGGFVFIDQDCWTVPVGLLSGGVDVLFYDGEHSRVSQAKALPHYLSAMSDRFIMVVDDFNWPQVSDGNQDGISAVSHLCRLEKKWEINTPHQDDPEWHNGLFVGVFKKL